MNGQTLGGWIQAKRIERNLTPGHLAAKMGIAQAVVRSWEKGISQPDSLQLPVLESILGALPNLAFAFPAEGPEPKP